MVDVCEQQKSIKYSVKRLKEHETKRDAETKLDAETPTSKLSNDLKRTGDLSSEKERFIVAYSYSFRNSWFGRSHLHYQPNKVKSKERLPNYQT